MQKGKGNSAMKKIFVIDTSVLIHEPNALDKFGDNQLVMPMTVDEIYEWHMRAEAAPKEIT